MIQRSFFFLKQITICFFFCFLLFLRTRWFGNRKGVKIDVATREDESDDERPPFERCAERGRGLSKFRRHDCCERDRRAGLDDDLEALPDEAGGGDDGLVRDGDDPVDVAAQYRKRVGVNRSA